MNLAWPNYLQRQSFLQRQVDYFRALPSKRRRGHVYLSIKDTYRWGDALKSQVKDTPPRDQIGKATCAEKYFELGFLIGYAAQSLKISQELLSYPFSDPRRRNWAPPVHHAISHLSRALIVLDEYFAVQTGTCVEIVDLRVKERIYDLVKTPVLTKNVMPMVEEVDAVWINMQNRIMLGCPGSGDDDDEANDGFSSDTGVTEAGESTEHPQMDQSRPVRSVEEAESLDFTGRYNLSDPKRSYQDYHGAVTFFANGRFKSWENPGSKPLAGSGGWSFDPKTKIFTIDWYDGGKFSGYVKGNTRDFVITGHWADGKPGRLRIHR
jgi:hypothetical protein